MGCKASRAAIDSESEFDITRRRLNPTQIRHMESTSGTSTGNGTGAGLENSDDTNDSEVHFHPRSHSFTFFERMELNNHRTLSSRRYRNRLSRRMGSGLELEVDPYRSSEEGDNNLNQLRSEMLTLERMFQTLLQSQRNGTPSASNNSSYPPASAHTIENLPTIVVSDHDLEDGCNKECSICFLEFNVNDTVSRLPCGHFFHGECINEWLQKRCTCPICRWELETEDSLFEIDRIERMKSRKIRVKDHELDRMCIEGLQEMAGTKGVKNRAKLIKTIKSLNSIDVITQDKNLLCKKTNYDEEEKEEICNVDHPATTCSKCD